MNLILILLAGPIGIFGIMFGVGMMTPKDHRTSIKATFNASAETIYRLVRDYSKYPEWRSGVKSMKKESDVRFVEESKHGMIPYLIVEDVPNLKVVSKIDDPTLPFSGTWTFEIVSRGDSTELVITEAGSVSNPIFRFFSKYVFSHEKTIRTYFADLERKLATTR